jgi:hypothetical protein
MFAGAALPGPSPLPLPLPLPEPEAPAPPLPGPFEPEAPVAEATLDGIPEGREAVPDMVVMGAPEEAFEAFGAADVPEAEAGGAVEAAVGL